MNDNKQNMPNYDDKTIHRIITCDSKSTQDYIRNKTIGLVVTSPPYPMVQMWDECFSNQNEEVKLALTENRFKDAFEHMHKVLDKIWEDVDRVLMDGGVVCINIGDATRNCDELLKSSWPWDMTFFRTFIGINQQILQTNLWDPECIHHVLM